MLTLRYSCLHVRGHVLQTVHASFNDGHRQEDPVKTYKWTRFSWETPRMDVLSLVIAGSLGYRSNNAPLTNPALVYTGTPPQAVAQTPMSNPLDT